MAPWRNRAGQGAGVKPTMKKHIATAFVLGTMLFMSGAVCAGVMRVLADIVNSVGWKEEILAWMLCGALALIASLLFLDGGIRWSVKLLSRI